MVEPGIPSADPSELESLKKQLVEKSILFDSILQGSVDMAIATTDPDTRITYCNPVAEKYFDRSMDDIVGRTVLETYTHRIDSKRFRGALEIVREQGVYCFVIKQNTGNGIRLLETTVTGIHDRQGNLTGFCFFSRDITEQKSVEEALRKSETFLLEAQRQAHLGSWTRDRITEERYWSDEMFRIMGIEPRTVTPKLIDSIIHHEDNPRFQKLIHEAEKNHHELLDTEFRMIRPNGDIRNVNCRIRIEYNDTGTAINHFGTLYDITERTQAQQALVESRAFLEEAQKLARLGYWTKDKITDERKWSPEMFKITGLKPQPITDELVKSFFHPEDRELYNSRMKEALKVHESIVESDFQILRPNGDVRHVHDMVSIEYNEDFEPLKYFGVMQDITWRKNMEEEKLKLERQLLHSQKLESLGILAGGIAHDFNNILMGILGNADLALEDLSPMSPAFDRINDVILATKHAAGLSKQMLAYSGMGRFIIKPVDLGTIISEITHLLNVSVSKNVVLSYDLAETLPDIEGDATQLRQVIINLVTNASEAIGSRSGFINISTDEMDCDSDYLSKTEPSVLSTVKEPPPEGHYVFLEISDTGCGMTGETLERIFDPFFTTKFTGRGLGMAALLGIVKGHNGTIRIESEPGRGSTIRVLFPAMENHVPEQDSIEKPMGKIHATGTILVVDDERTVRNTVTRMLERAGFNVLSASNGMEAVDIYREKNSEILCVVLDLTMPHMNGEDCFAELRNINPSVRILMSSGFNQEEVADRLAGYEISAFIQKPYRFSELITAIQKVLQE